MIINKTRISIGYVDFHYINDYMLTEHTFLNMGVVIATH